MVKEKEYHAKANRTPDEKVCESVDGSVEEIVTEKMDIDGFKSPIVAGMEVDEALILIKTKPWGQKRM